MKKTLQASPKVAAQFHHWQMPRRGNANPENQTNDVWSWLIQTRAWPHAAHKATGSGEKQSPGWCFDRYGQSETRLPDGTIVFIGGEHEDGYDPDFYIYNDIVVLRPDGTIEIYGYPPDLFPATDFHTATLCDDQIIIIGGSHYPRDRDDENTLVFRLQLSDFSIQRMVTKGDAPAWLYKHQADLRSGGEVIVCSGGEVTHHPTKLAVENLSTWESDLKSKTWSVVMTKPFQRWLLVREDESCNELWGIGEVARASRSSRVSEVAERYRCKFSERGHVVDLRLFDTRFAPPIPHSHIGRDAGVDSHRVHKVLVDGVTVRFVEDTYEITVTVEGQLSSEPLKALERHGLETYSALEGVPYKSIHL